MTNMRNQLNKEINGRIGLGNFAVHFRALTSATGAEELRCISSI